MLKVVTGLLALAILTACGSDGDVRRQAYLDANYYERLELPPDLTEPVKNRSLQIPQPTEAAKQRLQEQSANLEPIGDDKAPATTVAAVAPASGIVMAGAELAYADGRQWLQLQQPVDEIWQTLQAFLMHEGMPVSREESQIGMIETDWVTKFQMENDAGFIARAFTSFEPDRVDRFAFRIEAAADNNSRVFVTHSGMELFVGEDTSNYVSREREPALEAELLQRLALYVGAGQSALQQSDYRAYALRVRESEFDDNSVEVVGDLTFVSERLLSALEALEIADIEPQDETGVYRVRLGNSAIMQDQGERDEITEASQIMNFLFNSSREDGNDEFQLRLTEMDTHTRVDIENNKGELDNSILAEQFSQRLKQQLL